MSPLFEAPRGLLRDEAMPVADLFAALAERGAALVDRQHEVLEALQQREGDPQRLAGLFRLDHLAAQLRRNSNAALVLAGLPTIRSIRVPTMLSELACAAVSEVNGYQRVSMGAFPSAARRRTSHPMSSTCCVTSSRTRWPRRHGRVGCGFGVRGPHWQEPMRRP